MQPRSCGHVLAPGLLSDVVSPAQGCAQAWRGGHFLSHLEEVHRSSHWNKLKHFVNKDYPGLLLHGDPRTTLGENKSLFHTQNGSFSKDDLLSCACVWQKMLPADTRWFFTVCVNILTHTHTHTSGQKTD